MSEFIEKKSNFQVKFLETKGDVQEFAQKKLALVFLLPKEDDDNNKIFTSICANYETIPCAFVSDRSFIDIELSGNLGGILYRNFDDGTKAMDLNSGVSQEAVKQFIDAHRYPMVSEFD